MRGAGLAAHAIAEKLAEEVAWEKDMFIRHGKAEFNFEPTDVAASYLVSDMDELADPGSYLHLGNYKIAKQGQRVRVTVTKEEGDGQD